MGIEHPDFQGRQVMYLIVLQVVAAVKVVMMKSHPKIMNLINQFPIKRSESLQLIFVITKEMLKRKADGSKVQKLQDLIYLQLKRMLILLKLPEDPF